MLNLLNKGKPDAIQKIEGIGKTRSATLIKGRPYKKLEAVVDITGIGEKNFANIMKHAKKL